MVRVLPPRVVMITGASAGVGRSCARLFAKRGDTVGLLPRDRERLERARAEIETLGGRAHVFVADVADTAAVDRAAGELEDLAGPIDIWVNNAMTSVFSPAMEMLPDEFRRVTDVTYLGVVHGTLSALKRMVPRDRGCIVQVGSALAHRGIPLQSAYCAAKHAVQGFCESVRTELRHEKSHVHLTMVQMPALNTPQFQWVRSRLSRKAKPVPPIFQPEVAARAILWAADHPRREVWVGWPTVKAIVGNRLFPGLVDRVLASRGYDAQQTDAPEDPDRSDDLWQPVPGNFGAHGPFNADAKPASTLFDVWTRHRALALSVAAGVGVGALAALVRAGRAGDRSWLVPR